MFVTINMGLNAWDVESDKYTHADLSNNFKILDGHDHTQNRGVQLPTEALQDLAVTLAKLADGSVSSAKLQDLAVTLGKLAANSVDGTKIVDGSVGTAELADGAVTIPKVDPNLIPLGTVVPWYRPDSSINPPGGVWEVCDGRAWNTITNAWGLTAGNIPDLRNHFVLGATTGTGGTDPASAPIIGAVGGSQVLNLAHSHTSPPHSHPHAHTVTHSHGVNAHTHPISSDGLHNHGMHSRQNTHDQQGTLLQSLYIAGFNQQQSDAVTPMDGAHSHGGATGSAGSGTSTDSPVSTTDATATGVTTDPALSASTDNRPAFVGLLYIMRVR